ncbi:metal ABC transporter solute-binding protein, Zn/Mn family [Sutcliffiella cohnii]|uniref:ABC transporter substrate-binding protein n=1 Tax=Sutcliffiella cohnii TaxID=33932 RepID=A0A223KUD2_9BACI|nr:zinc ABC transporter substrate-binding protein [Sutcliffiella cohnii]AST92964.1 ABC transporter substrate-binding protein [Sutcliffiella cohnii]MED4016070.1 zinc ABC transporter substrate-binding protein [Sutcliffiella cohnii]
MKIKAIVFTFLLLIFTALVGCSNNNTTNDATETNNKIKVYTTIYPLEDFTNKIGGEFVDVESVYPPGADAHTYEPSTRVVSEIAVADVFIYSGVGAEGFADKMKDVLKNEKVMIIPAGKDIELLDYDHDHDAHEEDHNHDHDHDHDAHEEDHDHDHDHEHDAHEEDHDHDHDHDHDAHEEDHDHDHDHEHDAHEEDHDHNHDHDTHEEDHDHDHDNEHETQEESHDHDHAHAHDGDPHIWIDPILSIQLAENIKDALISLNPDQTEFFESNFNELKQELEAVHNEFDEMVQTASTNNILVSHAAYGYWEHRYGINQISVTGLSPTDEPSQRQLTEIIKTAQENDIKYVIFDQNITGKIAEMVRTEINAEALTLHNLEALTEEDIENNEDYFSLMRKNIETLRKALN